jgi:hypothetical protein
VPLTGGHFCYFRQPQERIIFLPPRSLSGRSSL